ncbi:outer membrane beta-barrel protein [Hymenobacter sp. BT683]|uniref:Outer membrane beta-barrel protein n=1 Tax=Hymenobacter jeongseonensis TaxID=2791027 RepID=A0ABS0IFN4_9BACT|nr:outer membrane beta-barrel protein [Hymenobacter jeongseonensis]MBF9237176.1 outer membrane beta-barrel protein [Hymenobacter jeongseonensis]
MTDRKPDDLFDALRDRLADYGQEPPAQLWAGIRAQLPPPVAQPQLRRRRRRWAPLGLLLLLFTVGGGAGWLWWKPGRATRTTATSQPAAVDIAAVNTDQPATTGNKKSASGAATTESYDQPTSATQAEERAVASVKAAAPSTQPLGSSANNPDLTKASSAIRSSVANAPSRATTSAAARVSGARVATRPSAITAAAGAIASSRSKTRRAKELENGEMLVAANRTTRLSAARTLRGQARRPKSAATFPSAEPNQISSSATQPSGRAASQRPKAGPTVATAAHALSVQKPNPSLPAGINALAGVPATSVAAAANAALPLSERVAETSVQSRVAVLQLATSPLSSVLQLTPVEVDKPPVPPIATRWAVQVLAGPALTYRQLAAGAQTKAPSPLPAPLPVRGQLVAVGRNASGVADLERPALGSGAQVTVRHTLTKNWNVSAGLGYSEYATRLVIKQVYSNNFSSTIPNSIDSTGTSFRRRDTYRFATVPLRVGYGWAPTGRWRVGLVAGVDAALYVGGNSTEGSSCACTTQNWGFSGSPYRRFSLGTSLGADFRYQLTGQWELVAQPTATYFLTPLTSVRSGYYPRRPLGATALLGVSLNLP